MGMGFSMDSSSGFGGNPSRQPGNSLSAESLTLAAAAVAGMAPDEVRKFKTLHIKNAIAEYEAFQREVAAFGCVQVLFAIIPLFWPFLYLQRRMINSQRQLFKTRIQNALEVWSADLQGETFVIDGEPVGAAVEAAAEPSGSGR